MHVARPYKGVFRDRIMCRSLASVDNAAACRWKHEHWRLAPVRRGQAHTCRDVTDPWIRGSTSGRRLGLHRIDTGFQWIPRATFFCAILALGFDTCCFLAPLRSLCNHLTPSLSLSLSLATSQRLREIVRTAWSTSLAIGRLTPISRY